MIESNPKAAGSEPGHKFHGNQFVTVPGEEVFVHESPREGKSGNKNFTVGEAFTKTKELIGHDEETAHKVSLVVAGDWQANDRISTKTRKAMGQLLDETKDGDTLHKFHPLANSAKDSLIVYRGGVKSNGVRSWTTDKQTAVGFMQSAGTDSLWRLKIDKQTPALDLDKLHLERYGPGASEAEVVVNSDKCKNKAEKWDGK